MNPNVNCTDIRPLFHAYVDNELDVVRSLDVEQHLQQCPNCAAARRSVLALRSALQHNDLNRRAPEGLRRSIRHMARAADQRQSTLSITVWRWLAGSAVTIALLTLLLRPAGLSDQDGLLNEAVSSHVRSLMAEHLTDVTSTDQHTVKPWFNGKLDFAPTVKDFTADGFPLIGGRLDYLDQQTVAALVYRHNKHIINVFVWPDTTTAPATEKDLRGFSVIRFTAGGLRYCLVSDLNQKELNDLADLLKK